MELEKERVELGKEKENNEEKEGVEGTKEAKNECEQNMKSEKSGINVKLEVKQSNESNPENPENHSLKIETHIKTEEVDVSTSIPSIKVETQQNPSVGSAPSLSTQPNHAVELESIQLIRFLYA